VIVSKADVDMGGLSNKKPPAPANVRIYALDDRLIPVQLHALLWCMI
jgi:hypothetical protein